MTTQDKAVTAFVRSLKKALASQHGLEVGHAALRAAYLSASGENPHAFAAKSASKPTTSEAGTSAQLKALQDLVREAPNYFAPQYDFEGAKLAWLERAGLVPTATKEATLSVLPLPQAAAQHTLRPLSSGQIRQLYLAADDAGCLDRMSLDPEGSYLLPEDWAFSRDCGLLEQSAQIPSVRRYGLPEYLANPNGFFDTQFSLRLDPSYSSSHEDLGDDSGDSCTLSIRMPDAQWERLVLAVLSENEDLHDEVAEWVGLNYKRNFDALFAAQKVDYVERYLQTLEEEDGTDELPSVRFEWVYPDEDGGDCEATLDWETGVVTLAEPDKVPQDIDNDMVRTRIMVDDLSSEPFEVYFKKNDTDGQWCLRKKVLAELKQLLDSQA